MANIPKLPNHRDLFAAGPASGPYGPHCNISYDPDANMIALRRGVTVLAVAALNKVFADTAVLDSLPDAPTVLPYVNAFIAPTMKVEKYWRTKSYRQVPIDTPNIAPIAVAPAEKIEDRIARVSREAQGVTFGNQPEVEIVTVPQHVEQAVHVEQAAPVAQVQVEQPVIAMVIEDDTAIPGLIEHPKPHKPKAAGKGYLNVDGIVVKETDYATLLDAWTLRQNGTLEASVLITGPAGTAKTSIVKAFAASLGVPYLKVDGGAIRTADDWAGAFRQDPNTKVWAHRWSSFARVLKAGRPCIVLVDEINRTESPQALNALTGLLDGTGQLIVPDANGTLSMPNGVLVVATANIGPEFVGTLPIDGAVRQRFPYGIRMRYPDEKIEVKLLTDLTGISSEVAMRLVKMADMQRMNREDAQQYPSGSVISTRTLVDIARRIATCNAMPRIAVESTLMGQFDVGDEQALRIVMDTQFPVQVTDDGDIIELDADEIARREAEQELIRGPWNCPSCGREQLGVAADGSPVMRCAWCNYERPALLSATGLLINLQNKSY